MTENDYPYVALTLQTTGIHPSTGRIVTIDAIAFNDAGEQGQLFHAVLKPDIDAGPRHLHGLSTTDIEQAPAFGKILKSLDKLIDGRTLIVHDLPYTWGFLVAEARRAMMAAARDMQGKVEEFQKTLETMTVTGEAGAGLVRATANAKGELKGLEIDPSIFVPSEKQVVEDLILAAIKDAQRKAQEKMQSEMARVTQELGLPADMKLPF